MSTQDEIGRTLRRHADAVGPTPLTLDDVRGRARRIRRRRAAGTVAAVAAVAALVVPVSLLAGGDHPRNPDPAPSPSPTRGVDPHQTTLTTLQDGVIITPDGPRIPLQLAAGQRADGFAVLGARRYVVSLQQPDGGRAAALVDETGVTDIYPLQGSLAAAPDREAVAWVDDDGATRLLTEGADQPLALPPLPGADLSAVAITGHCTTDCSVLVRVRGGRGVGRTWSVSSTGAIGPVTTDVPAVEDATADGALLAGIDTIADDDIHACGGVYDVPSGAFSWHGCQDNVFAFSPAGDLVATTFSEGRGPTALTIRDARTGKAVSSVQADGDGWISSWAWEDDAHLLVVVVHDGGATSVERLGRDSLEGDVLGGFHTDPDGAPPVILPSQ